LSLQAGAKPGKSPPVRHTRLGAHLQLTDDEPSVLRQSSASHWRRGVEKLWMWPFRIG
jgi:hypothetical protein